MLIPTRPHQATLTVGRHTIAFETACLPAYDYLKSLESLECFRTVSFREAATAAAVTVLRYDDIGEYHCRYDAVADVMDVSFPWDERSDGLMKAILWHVLEFTRQRSGEYLLHASVVVRDGAAVVLTGPSESGKTITALDLCRNHGFEFYANDVVLVGLQAATPHLLLGEPTLRLRLSSLRAYDERLAQQVFGTDVVSASEPWNVKRDVRPEEIGMQSICGSIPIGQIIMVRLDRHCERIHSRTFDWSDINCQRYFHQEMAVTIRGGTYAPKHLTKTLVPLFIPSLDQPAIHSTRLAFMDALVTKCHLTKLRGTLPAVTDYIDDMHRTVVAHI